MKIQVRATCITVWIIILLCTPAIEAGDVQPTSPESMDTWVRYLEYIAAVKIMESTEPMPVDFSNITENAIVSWIRNDPMFQSFDAIKQEYVARFIVKHPEKASDYDELLTMKTQAPTESVEQVTSTPKAAYPSIIRKKELLGYIDALEQSRSNPETTILVLRHASELNAVAESRLKKLLDGTPEQAIIAAVVLNQRDALNRWLRHEHPIMVRAVYAAAAIAHIALPLNSVEISLQSADPVIVRSAKQYIMRFRQNDYAYLLAKYSPNEYVILTYGDPPQWVDAVKAEFLSHPELREMYTFYSNEGCVVGILKHYAITFDGAQAVVIEYAGCDAFFRRQLTSDEWREFTRFLQETNFLNAPDCYTPALLTGELSYQFVYMNRSFGKVITAENLDFNFTCDAHRQLVSLFNGYTNTGEFEHIVPWESYAHGLRRVADDDPVAEHLIDQQVDEDRILSLQPTKTRSMYWAAMKLPVRDKQSINYCETEYLSIGMIDTLQQKYYELITVGCEDLIWDLESMWVDYSGNRLVFRTDEISLAIDLTRYDFWETEKQGKLQQSGLLKNKILSIDSLASTEFDK